MTRIASRNLAAALMALAVVACNQSTNDGTSTGSAEVQVSALSVADVSHVNLTIAGSSLGSPRVVPLFVRNGSAWGGLVGQIPAGTDYTFSISATDSSNVVLYTGAMGSVAIVAGQTTNVVILAQQATAPTPFANSAPVIGNLTVSATSVVPNATVSVHVTASDPDGDALTYAWTAGGGSFADAAATDTTWSSATSGTFVLTLTVKDVHGMSASASVTVVVSDSAGKGGANVNVALNTAPVATNLTATPGYLKAGQATTLTSTASDPDGDALAYAWSSSCAGAFTGTGASPSFTLAAIETATTCTIHVVISDGRSAETTSDLTLGVGQAIFNAAPVIVLTAQSDTSAFFGRSVSLYVQASDPEGGALTFQWSASAGVLSGRSDTASTSAVTFTAPSTTDAAWTVTATIRDPMGATASVNFTVASLGSSDIEFVFTSDAHYGLYKTTFRGASNVNSQVVNEALVAQANTLAGVVLPNDTGVHAGLPVGAVDFLIEGGDIANRMEVASAVQPDAVSWAQYANDYINGLALTDHTGARAPLITIPGNHDVSNAIGFWKAMSPLIDATSLVAIFNAATNPAVPRTTATYNYATDKVHFSKNFGGVHFAFVNMWPDSVERAWLTSDLAGLDAHTPVIIVCHDQPDLDTKHLKNPNGAHTINATDQFENMTEDYALESTILQSSAPDQRGLEAFLQTHKNIVAWFHGHTHVQEMATWAGPDNNLALPDFSVDSPMKGTVSSLDETMLAFDLGSIDVAAKQMTVREVRWNSTKSASSPITFATSKTVSLVVP